MQSSSNKTQWLENKSGLVFVSFLLAPLKALRNELLVIHVTSMASDRLWVLGSQESGS